jgi:hypothetical protein
MDGKFNTHRCVIGAGTISHPVLVQPVESIINVRYSIRIDPGDDGRVGINSLNVVVVDQ